MNRLLSAFLKYHLQDIVRIYSVGNLQEAYRIQRTQSTELSMDTKGYQIKFILTIMWHNEVGDIASMFYI